MMAKIYSLIGLRLSLDRIENTWARRQILVPMSMETRFIGFLDIAIPILVFLFLEIWQSMLSQTIVLYGIIHTRRIILEQQQPSTSVALVSIELNCFIIQTTYVSSLSNHLETTPGPLRSMERVVVCGRFK